MATEYVMENGLGDIDDDRFASALEQMKMVYEFNNEPDASAYFTDAYLPDASVRMLK